MLGMLDCDNDLLFGHSQKLFIRCLRVGFCRLNVSLTTSGHPFLVHIVRSQRIHLHLFNHPVGHSEAHKLAWLLLWMRGIPA